MKLSKQKKMSKRAVLYGAVAVIVSLLIAGALYGAITNFGGTHEANSQPDTPTQDSPATKEQNARDKENFINNVDLPQEDSQTEESADVSTTDIAIELAQADGDVVVTTRLPGFSNGTCNLSVINGQQSFEDSANILYQPSFSSCMGFSIPVNRLGPGNWQITVVAENNELTGAATKEIRVE